MPAGPDQPTLVTAILLLVFFAQAFKEMGIPSPGLTQSILLYAGYQFSHGSFYLGIGIILFAFLGSICGAGLIFTLTKYWKNKFLPILIRYVVIDPGAMEKAKNKIRKYSIISIIIGRSIPGLMAPTSIIAGTIKMPLGRFLLGITFSIFLWIIVVTSIGSSFGLFTPTFVLLHNRFLVLLGALLVVCILTGYLFYMNILHHPE